MVSREVTPVDYQTNLSRYSNRDRMKQESISIQKGIHNVCY